MKTKIMIIEDELRLGNLVSTLLKQSGYDTVVETDGKRGLQKIKLENPDVILTDVMLPGISGFEICKKVKQNSKLKAIPVITMTGRVDMQSQKQALKAGADFFIPKPYDLQFLLKMIGSIIKNKQAAQPGRKRRGFKIFSLFFFSVCLLGQLAIASPWIPSPGRSYHEIQNARFQGQNTSFEKEHWQYYGEYGIVPQLSIIGNFFSGSLNRQPFSQGELGLGWQLWKSQWHSLSLQQWLGNPVVYSQAIPNQSLESETRLALGGDLEKLPLFWTLEPGWRLRPAPAATQAVFRSIVGFKGLAPLEILAEYNLISSQTATYAAGDYQLQQISLKLIWNLPEGLAASLRITSDIAAQNTTPGSGLSLGVIKKL